MAGRHKIKFSTISIFPDIFDVLCEYGVVGRAIKKGIIQLENIYLRDFAIGIHGKVDDRPYGGGAGMVMKPEPIYMAILHAKRNSYIESDRSIEQQLIIYTDPSGEEFNGEIASEIAKQYRHIILICGRYEGIDQRIIDKYVNRTYSIGNYVLSGGEIPAMAIIDAVSRLIPYVLNNSNSINRTDHHNYTKPRKFLDICVPDVLFSGNHKEISRYRDDGKI